MSDSLIKKKESKSLSSKKYKISFNQNRSFELKVGRKMFVFRDGKKEHIVTEDIIKHPDFIQQKNYFSVKEVK